MKIRSTFILNLVFALLFTLSAQASVLNRVLSEVAQSYERSEKPIVIFDIDDTVVDVRYRTAAILVDFVNSAGVEDRFQHEVALLKSAGIKDIQYHLEDTFGLLGINSAEFLAEAKAFWTERFFTGRYLRYDRVIRAATSYVNAVIAAGGRVVFLTGRDEPNMGNGTRSQLETKGFPTGPMTKLILKPEAKMDDLVFKKEAFEWIRKNGTVVAGFENEPRNLNAIGDAFPEATLVYLKTRHSRASGAVTPKAFTVLNFRKDQ